MLYTRSFMDNKTEFLLNDKNDHYCLSLIQDIILDNLCNKCHTTIREIILKYLDNSCSTKLFKSHFNKCEECPCFNENKLSDDCREDLVDNLNKFKSRLNITTTHFNILRPDLWDVVYDISPNKDYPRFFLSKIRTLNKNKTKEVYDVVTSHKEYDYSNYQIEIDTISLKNIDMKNIKKFIINLIYGIIKTLKELNKQNTIHTLVIEQKLKDRNVTKSIENHKK